MGDIKEREEENIDLLRERAEREYAKEDVIEPEERDTYPASPRHSLPRQTRSIEGSVDGRNRPLTGSIAPSRRQRYSQTVETSRRNYREIQPDSMADNKISSMLKLNFGSFESTGFVVPPPKPFSVSANYYTDPHCRSKRSGSFDPNQFQDQPITGGYGSPWSRGHPRMQMPITRMPIARRISPQPIMRGRIPWMSTAVRPVMPFRATIVHHMSSRRF
ncbi:hypothetical protein CHS0354_015265 [Potamilus streckersoni]|uniref:Uncharacterized protein n=1 Tax=Potamilus streckersoni TaxID=2493646 RepID=A0AAE0RV42_9BIVA|nr:hypothetical protein CHS0354_015265 [Potamilus streckersoni]